MGLRGARARPYSHRLDMEGTRARELLKLAKTPPEKKKWKLPWEKKGLDRWERVVAFLEDLTITSGMEAGRKLEVRPWQRDFIRDVYATRSDGRRLVRTAVLSLGRKNGKGLALDTPIPTPFGWSTMGALKVGDEVFNEHGQPCRIRHVSPVHIGLKCWRLCFADGSSIIADEQHRWAVRNPKQSGRFKVLTTPDIAADFFKQRPDRVREHRYTIPIADALELPEVELSVSPYVLGYWLGNGDNRAAIVTLDQADAAVIGQELEAELGFEWRAAKVYAARAPRFALSRGCGGDRTASLQYRLRMLGVLGDKHIPEQYLWASRAQRLALLQGLMDSDGTASAHAKHAGSPRCYFEVMNGRLAHGALALVRSLGFKATIIEDMAKLHGRPIGPVWSVAFTAHREDEIFRLPRKLERLLPRPQKHRRSRSNAIVACDEVASVPTVCIEVDSPSHLFLAGEGLTPTHNTQIAAALALCHLCGPEAESRGEVYSCANDRFQAAKIFHEMVAIIDRHPYLTHRTNIIRFQKQIEDLTNGSIYVALSSEAKTKMGLSPSMCVYDELGVSHDRTLYDAMDSAQGARKEPLLMVISTQAADDFAPLSRLIDYGLKVQAGDVVDRTFHLTLYRAPDDADPWAFETWKAANPALGDFRSLEDVERLAAQAEKMSTQESSFRNLILNQRVAAETRFIERSEWTACAGEVKIPDGARCNAALDLGSTRDHSALVLIHEDAERVFHVMPFYWLPGDVRARAEEDKVPYEVWVKEGLITPIGSSTDPRTIALKIAELCGKYRIETLAFDRWRIEDLKRELNAIGCPVPLIAHGQGFKDMSPAVDIIDRMIVQRRIRHGGHPVLMWNAYNAVVTIDPAKNRKLDKAKSIGRIDGLVALAMAFSLTRVEPQKKFDPAAMIG